MGATASDNLLDMFGGSHHGATSSGGAGPSRSQGHSRTPSMGSSAAAAAPSNEPQLMLRGAAAGSARKWGPAQFESAATAARPPSATQHATSASGVGADLLGGGYPSGTSSSASHATAVPPAPKPLSERDRLAASIFGGPATGSSGGASSAAAPALAGASGAGNKWKPAGGAPAAAPAPKPQQQQQHMDLLAFDSPQKPAVPAVPVAAAAPPAAAPLDLLMDLDVPHATSTTTSFGGAHAGASTGAGASMLGGLDLLSISPLKPQPQAQPQFQQFSVSGLQPQPQQAPVPRLGFSMGPMGGSMGASMPMGGMPLGAAPMSGMGMPGFGGMPQSQGVAPMGMPGLGASGMPGMGMMQPSGMPQMGAGGMMGMPPGGLMPGMTGGMPMGAVGGMPGLGMSTGPATGAPSAPKPAANDPFADLI